MIKVYIDTNYWLVKELYMLAILNYEYEVQCKFECEHEEDELDVEYTITHVCETYENATKFLSDVITNCRDITFMNIKIEER